MHYYIITGASRGLGEAIVKRLLRENNQIYCLSRRINDDLVSLSRRKELNLTYVPCDLSCVINSKHVLQSILAEIPVNAIESITLINNAATIEPIKQVGDCQLSEITNVFNVNLVAPVILTSTFIQRFQTLPARKKIINISSTGCRKSYNGLSCYISSKAGLSQFTTVVAEEQKDQPFPVETILFEPGSMDTEMQAKIALAPRRLFPWVKRLIERKRSGLLASVDTTADHILKLISGRCNALQNGKISQILMTAIMSPWEEFLIDLQKVAAA